MAAVRMLKLLSLALATALLSVGAWSVQSELKQLAFERNQYAQAQQSLQGARQLLPAVEEREQLMRSLKDLESQVTRLNFDPLHWSERRLRRSAGPASRVQAEQFLAELGRGGAGAIFITDVFDLATVSPDAGLFHPPEAGDKGLSLSASGSLHFRNSSAASPIRSVR